MNLRKESLETWKSKYKPQDWNSITNNQTLKAWVSKMGIGGMGGLLVGVEVQASPGC